MKEFSAQTGGRYTYADDIINLQELALAFLSIFNNCDNFIVSGCEVNGSTISSGYVYLNGKLRYFSGATGIVVWPQYIYESNKNESVAYANGSDKVGRTSYDCLIAGQIPSSFDPITNAVPQAISIWQNGGKTMKDAFFGKYSLLLSPSSGKQEVSGAVSFANDISIRNSLSTKGRVLLQNTTNSTGTMNIDEEGSLVIQLRAGDLSPYKLIIKKSGAFQLFSGNSLISSISKESHSFNSPVTFSMGTIGNLKITGSDIYNSGQANDEGRVNINMASADGDKFFRNTYIGNGKGKALVEVNGKSSSVTMNASLLLAGDDTHGLKLKSNFPKSSTSLQKTVDWVDSDGNIISYAGYNSANNNVFSIKNTLANIEIIGLEAVNICPGIMENGVSLSKKYVLSSTYNSDFKKVAMADKVYTIEQADRSFAKLSGGLSQFMVNEVTKETLRRQIDAISLDKAKETFPELSKCLSDMATNDAQKKQICDNIGAAYHDSCQPKLQDSGWIRMKDDLYARQIGNIVSIQGTVVIMHGPVAFTLPINIDPPIHNVNYSTITSAINLGWRWVIRKGNRNAVVEFCNNHGKEIEVSLTYMV